MSACSSMPNTAFADAPSAALARWARRRSHAELLALPTGRVDGAQLLQVLAALKRAIVNSRPPALNGRPRRLSERGNDEAIGL